MSLWFLDASVLLAAEDPDDDNHAAARHRLQSQDSLVTLDLAFYEVTNLAVRAWRDGAAAHRLQVESKPSATTVGSFVPKLTCLRRPRLLPRNATSPCLTPPTS